MAQQGLFRKREGPLARNEDEFLEAARRTRTLDARYSNLERRSQIVEENMIEHHRKISSELKMLNEDLSDMKKQMAEMNERMGLMIAEMRELARKEDVLVLKKYIDYWDPLKFVTQKQVEKVVEEILREKEE